MERKMNRIYIISTIILLMFTGGFSTAQERSASSSDSVTAVKELERELADVKTGYEKKISELESRIKKLEEARVKEESASELDNLLKAAQDLKGRRKRQGASISRVFRGSERQQPQLNPEISMTGDFFGSYSSSNASFIEESGDFTDGRNRLYLREAELNIVAPLDPFTRGKFFFGIPGSASGEPLSTIVEEAYMEWLNLPGGLNLKIGEFNTQFGVLNRWHDHGLPQVDRPKALTNLFGTGNFGGIGISGNLLFPNLWAHVNELDIEVISGGDGFSFDDSYENVIGVAHFKNYYDLTRNAYVEIGLSGAHGYNDMDNDFKTTLAGIDLAYKWVPAGRSHYRTTEFRSEFFLSHREETSGYTDSFGFYSYITNKMGPRSWAGIRFGYSEMPWDTTPKLLKDEYEWDISPTFDFWQSEFVMMRLQYSYTKRSYAENDHSIILQSVWSMGPHKHEAY